METSSAADHLDPNETEIATAAVGQRVRTARRGRGLTLEDLGGGKLSPSFPGRCHECAGRPRAPMSLVNLSSELLWASGAALQICIIYLCWRRKFRSEFPIFFNYNVFVVISYVVLFFLYRPSWEKAYFISYWVSSGIEALLGFAAIYEVFRNSFKPFDALRDFAGIMFRWSALVLALVATILTCTSIGQEPRAMMAILCLERGVMVMQCGLLLFLLLFSSRLGMTWQHHGFGISLGFGLFAATQLILNSVRSQLGPSWGCPFYTSDAADDLLC